MGKHARPYRDACGARLHQPPPTDRHRSSHNHVRHGSYTYGNFGGASRRCESVGKLGFHRHVHQRCVQARKGCLSRHRVVDPYDFYLRRLRAARPGVGSTGAK